MLTHVEVQNVVRAKLWNHGWWNVSCFNKQFYLL